MLEKKNERRSFANKSEVVIGMNGCLVDMSYVKMGHKSFVMSFSITSAGLACLEAGWPWLNPAPEQVQCQALSKPASEMSFMLMVLITKVREL